MGHVQVPSIDPLAKPRKKRKYNSSGHALRNSNEYDKAVKAYRLSVAAYRASNKKAEKYRKIALAKERAVARESKKLLVK